MSVCMVQHPPEGYGPPELPMGQEQGQKFTQLLTTTIDRPVSEDVREVIEIAIFATMGGQYEPELWQRRNLIGSYRIECKDCDEPSQEVDYVFRSPQIAIFWDDAMREHMIEMHGIQTLPNSTKLEHAREHANPRWPITVKHSHAQPYYDPTME